MNRRVILEAHARIVILQQQCLPDTPQQYVHAHAIHPTQPMRGIKQQPKQDKAQPKPKPYTFELKPNDKISNRYLAPDDRL